MVDHDMEMIAMNDVHLRDHPRQNGDTLFEIDSDDDDSASEDDGSRGLLTGNSERSYRHEQRQSPRQSPPQKSVWPQIKSIVIEVRVDYLHFLLDELIISIAKSAPALLMTTISLSFTGKLLDKVSVRPHNSHQPLDSDTK